MNEKIESRLMQCSICGKTWNVSIKKYISQDKYICPHCARKLRDQKIQRRNQIIKQAVKMVVLTMIGIMLYKLSSEQALAQRGYKAHGGEVFFLLLPLFAKLISTTITDYVKEIKNA